MFDRFSIDLGSIWGGSEGYLGGHLGGIPALVRTSTVDLEVSGVDLGWIWPSCAPAASANIYRKSIENQSNIYRTSIDLVWIWGGSELDLGGSWGESWP